MSEIVERRGGGGLERSRVSRPESNSRGVFFFFDKSGRALLNARDARAHDTRRIHRFYREGDTPDDDAGAMHKYTA